jgi:hypothetical protein
MARVEGALGVNGLREGGGNIVEIVIVSHNGLLTRLAVENDGLNLLGLQHSQEGRSLCDGGKGLCQFRVEARAAAAGRLHNCRIGAAAGL